MDEKNRLASVTNNIFYIYQHVPKCGGKSFRQACQNYFHLVVERPPKMQDAEQWAAFLQNKVDFDALPEDTMICGHLIKDGIRPRERYAEEFATRNGRVVTVLREPRERAVSSYFFAKQQGKPFEGSVDDRLLTMKNPMAKFLGFQGGDVDAFLQEYFLVGVTEYMQQSIDLFVHLIGKEPIEAPRVNVTKVKENNLLPSTIEVFEKNNDLDYALYRGALRLLRERCQKELGIDLPALQTTA